MKYRLTHKVCKYCNNKKEFKEFFDSKVTGWCNTCWDSFSAYMQGGLLLDENDKVIEGHWRP